MLLVKNLVSFLTPKYFYVKKWIKLRGVFPRITPVASSNQTRGLNPAGDRYGITEPPLGAWQARMARPGQDRMTLFHAR